MDKGRIILSSERFAITLERLAHQLVEDFGQFEETCLIGLQPRGVILAEHLHEILTKKMGVPKVDFGKLDITFYRDDFRRREKPLEASVTDIDFLVENKNVILIDDVLYTGRTVQAGLTALNHYGRPKSVELLALIDRRFNRHLPIQPSYSGMQIDALDEAYVKVDWREQDGQNQVLLFSNKADLDH